LDNTKDYPAEIWMLPGSRPRDNAISARAPRIFYTQKPNPTNLLHKFKIQQMTKRIALVTEELSAFGPSGGIGAAFLELSYALSAGGHQVDLLFFPHSKIDQHSHSHLLAHLLNKNVNLIVINGDNATWDQSSAQNRAYIVYRHLRDCEVDYDCVHFHDYKGLGFFLPKRKKPRYSIPFK